MTKSQINSKPQTVKSQTQLLHFLRQREKGGVGVLEIGACHLEFICDLSLGISLHKNANLHS
jgi:hypothetical protein